MACGDLISQKGTPGSQGRSGFRVFDSEGTLANPDEVLAGGVASIDPALGGPHARQLPLNLQVISF